MMFRIERNGEVLSSNNNLRLMALDTEQEENAASFGRYVVNEDGSYEITIDYHNDYNFSMSAIENGEISVDINYYDFDGVLVNSVSFQKVSVTDTTTVETSSFNEFGGYELYLIDGEGDDIIGWTADGGETVSTPDEELTEYINSDENDQPDEGDQPEKGDVNSDGRISSVDAVLVLRYLANFKDDNANVSAMDYNDTGGVTSLDAVLILRHIAGLD